jgi:hypothetical protein
LIDFHLTAIIGYFMSLMSLLVDMFFENKFWLNLIKFQS